jgi:ribose transport system permease protein
MQDSTAYKKAKIGQLAITLAPIAGMLLLIAAYVIVTQAKDFDVVYGLTRPVLNGAVVCAVVATGATMIYAMGSFDISLGAAVCFSSVLGQYVYGMTGNLLLMLAVMLGVSIGISLIEVVLASVFNLPVFITTVAALSVLSATSAFLIKAFARSDSMSLPAELSKRLNGLNNPFLKVGIVAAFALICFALFELTGIGRKVKFLGGNPVCAKLSGISSKKMAFIAFIVSGFGIALGSFLTLTSGTSTVSAATGINIGMDVLVAIVFGGMPISGGARSKIYAACIGAVSMSLLTQLLYNLGFDYGITQMIKAALFLVVVFITALNYRTKTLAR